ncbi:hypothetical protein PWG14_01105 (plasmid) [Chromobacterium amazonense]|uniref:hypothetical protein n=1 Tax=Chromobacterium amazonense TaxID=1382803 RepID=UPI00237DA7DA|nr:hypothetical protein [Chromobacterium amazonense]MDE1711399.1 hypothetical protein [Chromobacterium amazonense]
MSKRCGSKRTSPRASAARTASTLAWSISGMARRLAASEADESCAAGARGTASAAGRFSVLRFAACSPRQEE